MTTCRTAGSAGAYRRCLHGCALDNGTLALGPAPSVGPLGANAAPAAPATLTASCGYVDPVARGIVVAPAHAFERLRTGTPATVSSPAAIAAHEWHDGSRTAAVGQRIRIEQKDYRVVRPRDGVARDRNLPSTEQLAAALRAVPKAQRESNDEIILSPVPNPGSTPGHTVAASAGSGTMTFFPMDTAQTQHDVDNRLMHETGHNYQGTLWRSGDDVALWTAVIARDGRSPSPYAGSNSGEDFCEFLVIYDTSLGSACEAAARRLYPNRWRQMERYGRGAPAAP